MREVYKLTTDEVREAFSLMDDDAATEENYTNFDYWLATERVRMAELAQEKLIDKIKAIRDREANYGDYDYYYGVDALLEELGENK